MIDLYTWPTPNGHKIHIMLEELGLAYKVHAVNINEGDQFSPAFLKISPNNKMPAIVDPDGPGGTPLSLFESGAILIYLAEKTDRFLSSDPHGRYVTLQWLMFQKAGIGPLLGQNHHFRRYAPEKIDYAIDRYTNEAKRLYSVLDRRLSEAAFLAGDDYSIADISTFPWLRSHENQGVELNGYPHVQKWFDGINNRPAVQRGIQVLADRRNSGQINEQARDILFGTRQYDRN
ncbi:MAG: glutathione binding-like protein [Pseudomonadota bacterium]